MGERVTSFSDLWHASRKVSEYLRKEHICSGDKVLLLWENSPEYVAALFGVWMVGGVPVPLNPMNTTEMVSFIATNCESRFAIVTRKALTHFKDWWSGAPILTNSPEMIKPIVLFHDLVEELDNNSEYIENSNSNKLAMVLYTSGTTGAPKGVMLTHRNLETNTRSILSYLHLTPKERTLVVLPFYYSYGNSILLTHIATGAALILENGFAFVTKALETMRRERITGLSGVPSHFSILINRSRFLEEDWPYLRYLTCAGGYLPATHIRKLRDALPHVDLHVMYGQTEGAARLSSLDPKLIDKKIGSVGNGIPGVELRVVNKQNHNVEPGEVGELIARGENLMRGYLGDIDGTRDVLRNGWLFTGDIATVDDEGFVYIKGRAKEFIKSGGYRISPVQVEEQLLRHPDIQECCVVGLPDEILGEKIVAAVCTSDSIPSERWKDDVMAFVRKQLPHYMHPTQLFRVEAIPKTDTGKPKRLELRDHLTAKESLLKN